jgi:hypothetical protein
MTTLSVDNSGKQAPRWFRIFKKIYINTENTAIAYLLLKGYTEASILILAVKMGSSWLLENLETVMAEN